MNHLRAAVFAFALGLLGTGIASARADTPPAIHVDAKQTSAPGRIAPLHDRSGLASPKLEKVVRLERARVVLADYPLIRHDFAVELATHFSKALSSITNDEIDTWLLASTAFVAETQARQTLVNTPIAHGETTFTALRPADYGRALVYEPAPNVLIDVKGAGAEDPLQEDHGNGLATLGEAIREYAYEHLVHKIFEHGRSGQRTVGHYAVIDAGFDVKHADGHTDPAGLILRQAHRRATGDLSALNNADTKRVEIILRRYGITSAGAYQDAPYDALNLQGTSDGAILDFGGFLAMKDFQKPAYHFDRTPEAGPRYKPLLSAKKEFPQPDEELRVPYDVWGYGVSGKADPVKDNPTIWSHQLALALRNGTATRKDAEQHMQNLLGPVEARMLAHPEPARFEFEKPKPTRTPGTVNVAKKTAGEPNAGLAAPPPPPSHVGLAPHVPSPPLQPVQTLSIH